MIKILNHSLKIHLPDDFNADKVEVIILPLEEKKMKKGIENLRGKLNLTDSQYKDFQDDTKNSREGWGENI